MLGKQIILGIIGLSGGMIVAGGLFAFITSLGIISDFADRTHTADKILLYEDAVALGGVVGNVLFIYDITITHSVVFSGVWGLLAGIFVGCWAMALAEVLNVFPIFVRRAKLLRSIPYILLSIAVGKGVGAFIYFWNGW